MRHALKAFALATATGACFVFFWLASLILSWLILPLARIPLRGRPAIERERRCRDIVGVGFRVFIGAMRTLRVLVFHPRRVRLHLPDGPFVMIANHPTLIDVAALMAVRPRLCCVVKTELFRSIMIGPLLRYSGNVECSVGGGMEGASVVQQALRKLDQGQSILIFPEGTRSPPFGLHRFKSGVFEIARRANVPIIPIFITCDPPTLQKGLAWYALPKRTARYDIRQLPNVWAREGADSRRLARETRSTYLEHMDQWKAKLPDRARPAQEPASTAWAPRSPRI